MISNRAFIFALFTILAVIFITNLDSPSSNDGFPSLNARVRLSSLANSSPILTEGPTVARAIVAAEIINQPVRSEVMVVNLDPTNLKLEDAPRVGAQKASIFLLGETRSLYTLNAEFRHPLASLTKLMTAIIAKENMDQSQPVAIKLVDVLAEGDAGNFSPSEVFSVSDLVAAALIPSSNDAAESLARFYGREKFLQAMQNKAEELEMTNTTFADASGLSLLDQSSIADWQKLMEYIWRHHPDILAITREPSRQIIEVERGWPRTLRNTNQFAGQADFVGGKTGYTADAQGNLTSLFNYRGQSILITVFGAEDRFAETQKLYNWAKKVLQ